MMLKNKTQLPVVAAAAPAAPGRPERSWMRERGEWSQEPAASSARPGRLGSPSRPGRCQLRRRVRTCRVRTCRVRTRGTGTQLRARVRAMSSSARSGHQPSHDRKHAVGNMMLSLLEVEMAGKTQIVSLNDDTIISCKIPGSPHLDINIMGITWFWKNQMSEPESKVFEFFGDHQASFRPGAMVSLRRLERGDASLQLSEVQLRDAGEYRCMVTVTPQKAEGRILVKVVAFPNIILFVEQHTVQNNEENYFVCRANGFYPPNINITWEKRIPEVLQFQEITKDITTHPLLKNEDGTFNRTSSLKIKSSGEDSGTVYQCVVWHTSLHTPQRYNITLNVTGKCLIAHFPHVSPSRYVTYNFGS
ncbi:natural cytotoxicity triggering receptor 3 ligand 1 [Perognathus longimembris pacificus]|uniref:natural cytotoxicity triggering receptor 3 ligand 1 n=1 Tax=Perognathus longimembris pacificus TaxID=214514 RepID=UPI002019D0C2|nr:natural cytotoxicity triggering receptor 3 ligand 1 [Perognathus longimembris pacificus]